VIPGFELGGATPWESPELTALHRLAMRAHAWPAPDLAAARSGDTPWRLPLDGPWRSTVVQRPDAAPSGFERRGFDDSSWARVQVPSLFTMDPAHAVPGSPTAPAYTNIQMPFTADPPRVPQENPTALYRRKVTVPEAWSGRRVVLHLGGAESVAFVWVNGRAVGMSKDSRLAAEFDVTDAVRFGKRNTVCVMVVRWSDASYVEDQDQWWQAGLHRSVVLYSPDTVRIGDVHVRAGLADDLVTGTLDVAVRVQAVGPLPSGYSVEVRHETLTGRSIGTTQHGTVPHEPVPYVYGGPVVRLTRSVAKVTPWSAERPALSNVIVTLRDAAGSVVEVQRHRIGFRRV
jgi:beta-galactosidase